MAARASKRWLCLLLAAYLAAAVALGVVEAWQYWPGREKYVVAVPPPSASPRQVVLTYLWALDAHDRATAYAVSTPAFRSTVALWLSRTASITRIWIGKVRYYPESPASARYEVPVGFWYESHWWDQDETFPNGQQGWGFQLRHIHGRFLIDANGQA
jgi:hypothetical protein